MSQSNADILRRWFDEAMLGNRPELVDELFTETIVVHGKGDEVSEQTREDKKNYVRVGNERFPDATIDYDDPPPIEAGDYVVVRWITRGQKKDTGERFCFVHNYIYRLENGRIAEEWHCYF